MGEVSSFTSHTVTLKDGIDISKDTYLAVSVNDLAAAP
jgi:hypothetical protein